MLQNISPTHVEIDLDVLCNNFEAIRDRVSPSKVLCVVKADAYGHGAIECARALEKKGADYLGVAVAQEGVTLRKAGITIPILVFGGLVQDDIDLYFDYKLTFTISSVQKLKWVEARAQERGDQARVHIKIDTGMGRLGVHWQRLDPLVRTMKETRAIVYEGVFSHLANAGEDKQATRKQFDRFQNVCQQIREAGFIAILQHIANSTAAFLYPEMRLDMVRLGISLYGIGALPESPRFDGLVPVLSWKTKVVFFKVVSPGEGVGYGSTWTPVGQPERVVTLPVGYADGYGRRFANKTKVLIRGNEYPIVGRVCMDQCMVSLGPDGEAYNGDEVVLVGKQNGQEISVEALAEQLDTISYEILARIGARVDRVYKKGGRIISV